MTNRILKHTLIPAVALGLLAACGGGGSDPVTPVTPTYASKLHYVNPAATGWRLEADATTNDTAHLVLNLVGPTGTATKGAAFFLTCDTAKASWASAGGTDTYAKAGGLLSLGNAPQLFKSKLTGSDLQVGIFQKGGTAATLTTSPVVSVALNLASTSLAQGTAISLAPTSAKQAVQVDSTGTSQNITVTVGTLTAQ